MQTNEEKEDHPPDGDTAVHPTDKKKNSRHKDCTKTDRMNED